ncbi:MAG: Fis family transcriptional regulator [Kofleriaceae bacterium]|nr:Fis family transcriptional regulator [Kofleriaceae bacterium]
MHLKGGSGGGGGGGPVAGEPTELQGITSAHNLVRSAHGVVDIVWDNEVAAIAQAWADNCEWGHNAGRSDDYPGYVGENIYGASFVSSGAAVVESWASEEADYNYANNSCAVGKVCGHYTQVVWAKSLKLGCAVANCPNIATSNFVVCNYSPGGNFNGEPPY